MIAIASDHGGYELRREIMRYLDREKIAYRDFGVAEKRSVDYPDYAEAACAAVLSKECACAILICGTGIGISIAANKINGIRAALCGDTFSAKYTRQHNDANVLCLGGRVTGPGLACEIVDVFLNNSFEGGRHKTRVDKITALEAKQCRK
jgi:ribose 5-phosphate isomerase B